MKKCLSLLLSAILCVGLFACGETPAESDTTSAEAETSEISEPVSAVSGAGSDVSLPDQNFEPKVNGNFVIACDQTENRVVLYDMSRYDGTDLDCCELWSFDPLNANSNCISGVKYRENTVYGDVVALCASGGYACVVSYPEGKIVWKASYVGKNPHSIEILPDGAIVCVSSTGNTMRLYPNIGGDQKTYVDYTVSGAHGVLWDPDRELLWVLGYSELIACAYRKGRLLTRMRYTLPTAGGHDLSADFSDIDGLFVTTETAVYSFDKSSGRFSESLRVGNSVKGYGSDPAGDVFFCYPNGGPGRKWERESFAEWCTDTIYYRLAGSEEFAEAKSSTCAFYKVVAFYGKYQADREE